VKNHPTLKGVDLIGVGNPERSTLMVTKTLLFAGVGAGLFNNDSGAGSPYFRAIEKATGKVLHRIELPTGTTGTPMTYMVNGHQYAVVAVGGKGMARGVGGTGCTRADDFRGSAPVPNGAIRLDTYRTVKRKSDRPPNFRPRHDSGDAIFASVGFCRSVQPR